MNYALRSVKISAVIEDTLLTKLLSLDKCTVSSDILVSEGTLPQISSQYVVKNSQNYSDALTYSVKMSEPLLVGFMK